MSWITSSSSGSAPINTISQPDDTRIYAFCPLDNVCHEPYLPSMRMPLTPRNLTHDEKKAAEAAFQGLPFDPRWSATARSVYEGILNVSQVGNNSAAPVAGHDSELKSVRADRPAETAPLPIRDKADHPVSKPEASQLIARTREDAIRGGLLIDVSPIAQRLGLPLSVGVTKPLWDLAITASQTIPDDQHESRLRDVLMALRLRLATTRTTLPLIEFPALLTFPPEPIPQICLLHAVAQSDPANALSLTLALRDEVSLIISPLNN
jgi:hypothetical protein